MKKIKNNKFLIVFISLFLIALILLIVNNNVYSKYEKDYFYLDTYINVKLYSNRDKKFIDKVFKEIDYIYDTYHKLTSRYSKYDNIYNIYYLNNELDINTSIDIDPRLSTLISEGIKYYEITNGYINIASSNLISIWKEYIDKKEGIPTLEELNNANIDISNIVLEGNKFTKKSDIKLDLGAYAKGYITELVGDYLESIGINKYIIDAGGNIKVGDSYKKDNYTIGIQDPINTSDIFTTLKVNNKSVVTSGDYQRYYEYNKKRYNHIIDPYTKYPSSKYKSVTVISNSSYLADVYSTYLFLIDLDTGKKIVDNNKDIEAIWYIDKDNIIESKNINAYK